MAIDFGNPNTGRYYTVPDHADFTLPNSDWTYLALVERNGASSTTNYIVSTGDFGSANSINLYVYGDGVSGVGVKVSTFTETWNNEFTDSLTLNTPYWIYAVRRSGILRAGQIPLGGASTKESTAVAISGSQDSSTALHIGYRALGSIRPWNGRWEQVAFVSGYGMTTTQIVQLAGGTPLLDMPFAANIEFLLYGQTAADVFVTDLVGGHVATRQGTGYGTNETLMQSPYSAHTLVSDALTQANPASTPAITQTHSLVGDGATQANIAGESAVVLDDIGETITLAATGDTQGNEAETGSIGQTHTITHAPSIQDNIAQSSAVVREQLLEIANAEQSNAAATAAIVVQSINDLSADAITQANIGGEGQITRPQTLTSESLIQVNIAGTGAWGSGIIFETALSSAFERGGIKKPGIPNDAPEWLKTTFETILGRRGNQIDVPEQQYLTFSPTPTKAELESLYNYTNNVRVAVEQLLKRLDN